MVFLEIYEELIQEYLRLALLSDLFIQSASAIKHQKILGVATF